MLKRRRFLQVLALGVLPFGGPLSGQQVSDFSALEKTVQAELAETRTPGAAIVLVSGDRIVFSKGFGISNVETGAPVSPDMLFRIGSVTKMFTTATLTMLAEEGKLDLDAPISNYITGLPARLAMVTAHQLMSHTAGLRDEAPSYGSHDPDAMARAVSGWTDDYLFTRPGRVFSYSNPGLTLAGLLAQEITGKPFAKIVNDRLLGPLGMSRTTFEPTQAMTWPLSQGHNVSGERATVVRPFADNAGYWPAGFLFASATDLARFTIAFMNGGRIDGKAVFTSKTITKMSTGYAPTHSGPADAQYGYGLLTRDYRGVRIVEHGGSINGFGASVRMVPEQQFAVIILTNRSGGQLPRSAEAAMESLLPLSPKSALKASPQFFTAADLASLPGVYMQGTSTVELSTRGGKLFLKQGAQEVQVEKLSDTRFTAGPQREFIVVRGTNGKVEYLHSGLRALARQ